MRTLTNMYGRVADPSAVTAFTNSTRCAGRSIIGGIGTLSVTSSSSSTYQPVLPPMYRVTTSDSRAAAIAGAMQDEGSRGSNARLSSIDDAHRRALVVRLQSSARPVGPAPATNNIARLNRSRDRSVIPSDFRDAAATHDARASRDGKQQPVSTSDDGQTIDTAWFKHRAHVSCLPRTTCLDSSARMAMTAGR